MPNNKNSTKNRKNKNKNKRTTRKGGIGTPPRKNNSPKKIAMDFVDNLMSKYNNRPKTPKKKSPTKSKSV